MNRLARRIRMGSVAGGGGGGGSGVAAPTLSGTPTLVGSWDFDNTSSVHLTGSVINSIDGADSISQTLTSSGSPTLVSRLGHNAGFFVSSSQQFLQKTTDLGLNAAGVATVVLVCDYQSIATNQAFLDFGYTGGSGSVSRLTFKTLSSAQIQAYKGDNSGNPGLGTSATLTAGIHLFIARYYSGTTSHSINVDGQGTATTSAQSVAWPTHIDTTTLGARRVSGAPNDSFLDGYIFRVLVYPSALSDAQVEAIAVWATTNYGTANNA